jgi:hypothetical protein
MSKSCNNVIIIHHIYSKVQNNLGIKFPTTHWHKGERPPSLLTKNKLWTYLLAWVCFLFESMFTSLFKNPSKRCPPTQPCHFNLQLVFGINNFIILLNWRVRKHVRFHLKAQFFPCPSSFKVFWKVKKGNEGFDEWHYMLKG